MSTAIALRLLSTLCVALMIACVREVAGTARLGQIVFFRGLFALPVLLAYMALRSGVAQGLSTQRIGAHATRAFWGCASLALYYLSIAHLPLALASTLSFLSPLFIAIIISYRDGSPPSILMMTCMLIGLGGIAAILLPGNTIASNREMAVGLAAGVAAAATAAVAMLQIKKLTATEPTSTIAFYFALACSIAGLATLPFGWLPLDLHSLALLAVCGLFAAMGHIAMTESLARGSVLNLSVCDYAIIVWAVGLDAVIWQRLPLPLTWLGIGLIIASNLLPVVAGWLSILPQTASIPLPRPSRATGKA